MKVRTVGADEHLAGDMYHILMGERNGYHFWMRDAVAAAAAAAKSASAVAYFVAGRVLKQIGIRL